MSVGSRLLYSILALNTERPESAALFFHRARDYGLDVDSFHTEEDQRIWTFIHNHVVRYGDVPDINVVEVELDVRFSEFAPVEPPEFWLDKVRELNKNIFLADTSIAFDNALNAGDTEGAEELLMQAASMISDFRGRIRSTTLVDAGHQVVAEHDDVQQGLIPTGIPVGLPYLDEVTGGVQMGDAWAVAGRPSTGKSWISIRSSLGAYRAGYKVLFVSMEMPLNQVGRRSAAMGAGISTTNLRLGRLSAFARRSLVSYLDRLSDNREHFHILPGKLDMSVQDILLKVKELRPDLLVVDGAYMVRPSGAGRSRLTGWEKEKAVAEELKQLAINENIGCIGTYQFSRGGDKKGLDGIAGTDAIGQVASVVLGLTNEPTVTRFDRLQYKHLEILKGREGEMGKIRLACDLQLSQVEEDSILNDGRTENSAETPPHRQ